MVREPVSGPCLRNSSEPLSRAAIPRHEARSDVTRHKQVVLESDPNHTESHASDSSGTFPGTTRDVVREKGGEGPIVIEPDKQVVEMRTD